MDKVAKAVAELADCESLAAHISYGFDYYCTMDEAKGADGESIFDAKHRRWLAEEFRVRLVEPAELVPRLG